MFHMSKSLLISFATCQCYRGLFRKRSYDCNRLLTKRLKHRSNLTDLLTIMPKVVDNSSLRGSRNEQHVLSMEKGRPAAEIFLQVIGNGANGSARSLYVFTDQWRYLFNCGEGTQRLAHEYKTKLAKLEHIFFTHRSWTNIGGLPGLILTIQSIGVPKITFHGPDGIGRLFEMTKGFLLTDNIEINEKSVEEEVHCDHILKVKYVPFYGGILDRPLIEATEETLGNIESVDDYYDHVKRKRRRSNSKSPESSSKEKPLKKCKLMTEPSDNRDISIAYICQPTEKHGQLSLEKCLDMGVPPGPLLGQLKEGKDVVLPSGSVVRSVDVVNPPEPSPVFIVLECPSEEFLDGLLNAPAFMKHQKTAEHPNDVAAVVVHFTPTAVVNAAKYQQWLQRFPPVTEHLFLNESSCGVSSLAVHRIQHQLHLVHPGIFPLLKEATATKNKHLESANGNLNGVQECQTMYRYYLRPFKRSDTSLIPEVDASSFIADCSALAEFNDELSKLKIAIPAFEKKYEDVLTSKHPEVIFLGTGSSVPSKVRNTSGILINICEEKSILLDCSEGTCIQLFRFYGANEINDVLLKIKAIFISHLHADHHIGLIEVLQRRRKAALQCKQEYSPLDLIAPQQIMLWLKRYHEIFEPIMEDYRLIPNVGLLSNNVSNSLEYESLLTRLDLEKIVTAYARHCRHAFSVAITRKDAWKLVYSGDTMPCEAIVEIGKDCDLLIHEATMEDELKSEAILKRHSTTSEAIEQGEKMNAKFTMLTHFSQRYAKIPRYTDKLNSNVGIAFDNLKVKLGDLKLLPHLVPALKALFAEEYEDMEEKTAKKLRQLTKQRAKIEANIISKPAG